MEKRPRGTVQSLRGRKNPNTPKRSRPTGRMLAPQIPAIRSDDLLKDDLPPALAFLKSAQPVRRGPLCRAVCLLNGPSADEAVPEAGCVLSESAMQSLSRQPVASATRKSVAPLHGRAFSSLERALCASPPRRAALTPERETLSGEGGLKGSPSSAATHISSTGRFQQRSLRRLLGALRCTHQPATSPTALGAPPCPSPVQGPCPRLGPLIPPYIQGPLSSLPSRGPSPSLPCQHCGAPPRAIEGAPGPLPPAVFEPRPRQRGLCGEFLG